MIALIEVPSGFSGPSGWTADRAAETRALNPLPWVRLATLRQGLDNDAASTAARRPMTPG